jgi:hypothetical protein
MAIRTGIFILLFTLLSSLSADEAMTPEQLEKWFISDDEASTAQVSEGILQFIAPPEKSVLHSINTLTIDENSIESGWVGLAQCYRHLDAVPEAEVVYRYKHMRGLTITAHHNIGAAHVEGQSVQLRSVQKNAQLCIKAEVRIFYQNPDQTFSLVNGPFHRKFLDGYYPYHVTLKINYPATKLQLIGTSPPAQTGYLVEVSENSVLIDSHFEGILNTETMFRAR